jgi:hypothetical protein
MSDELDQAEKERKKLLNPKKNPFVVAHTEKRQQMVTALAKANDDPEWWKYQLEQLTDGTTLNALAEAAGVNFSIFRHWIMGDTKREKAYADALAEARRRKLDAIDQQLFNVALNPTGHPKYADSLRAAEILRNAPAQGASAGGSGIPTAINILFVSAKDGKPEKAVHEVTVIDQIP